MSATPHGWISWSFVESAAAAEMFASCRICFHYSSYAVSNESVFNSWSTSPVAASCICQAPADPARRDTLRVDGMFDKCSHTAAAANDAAVLQLQQGLLTALLAMSAVTNAKPHVGHISCRFEMLAMFA